MDYAINLAERGEINTKFAKRKPEKTRTTKWDVEIAKKAAFKREKARDRKIKWFEFESPVILEPIPQPFIETPIAPDWLDYFKQLLKWQRQLTTINNTQITQVSTPIHSWCSSSIITMLDCYSDSDEEPDYDYFP